MQDSAPTADRLQTKDPGAPARERHALSGEPARALSVGPDEEVRLEEPLAVWLHLSWGIELG